MTEEVLEQEVSEASTQGQSTSEGDDRIETLLKELQELKTAVKPATPQREEVVPMPERVPGMSQQEYIRKLEEYAASQRKEAERLKLARKYGIDPEELSGEYESPQDMQRAAELIAMKRQIEELKKKVSAPPVVPKVDTGGPVASVDDFSSLDNLYQEIRSGGKTPQTRRLLLDTFYKDPRKLGG